MNAVIRAALVALFFVLSMSPVWAALPMIRERIPNSFTALSLATGASPIPLLGGNSYEPAIDIGFTFRYLGTDVTSVGVNSNGWISLDPALTSPSFYDSRSLFDPGEPTQVIAPWWDSLDTMEILYQTTGGVGARVFTVQWRALTSTTGTSRECNFQLKLFESSDNIEFHYGPVNFNASAATDESASLGLKSSGGPGNFLDGVTGADQIGNAFLTSSQWPARGFRFSPGTQPALATGNYTVGQAGAFANLTEALAALNQRGISGPVTLILLDAVYDESSAGGSNWLPLVLGPVLGSSASNTVTVQPATGRSKLSQLGTPNSTNSDAALWVGSAVNTFTYGREPILALIGSDYVTIRDLDLINEAGNQNVDIGLLVTNVSNTNGAQNNHFQDLQINLNQAVTGKTGILQTNNGSLASASGASSTNTYMDLQIFGVERGIAIVGGSLSFPADGIVITASDPNTPNQIGAPDPLGIKGTVAAGISVSDLSNAQIEHNLIRNVSATTGNLDGLAANNLSGASIIRHNRINQVVRLSTSATNAVTGIRVGVLGLGTHSAKVYNNFVANLGSNYAGADTGLRILQGISLQPNGGGAGSSVIELSNNSVLINSPTGFAGSSTALSVGTVTGPMYFLRNNILANFSGAQSGLAKHYVVTTPSSNLFGNAGSVSNFNDLIVSSTSNGRVGIGNFTEFPQLSDWQAAMSAEPQSLSLDPLYADASNGDLHIDNRSLFSVGTPIAYVTEDIDGQARAPVPTIGADELLPDAAFKDSFE